MNKRLTNVLKLMLSLGLGGIIVYITAGRLDDEQKDTVKNVFLRANYFWVIVGPLLGMMSNTVRAIRWQMLLQSVGYNPRFSNVNHSIFVMYAGNLLFPRLGEVTRCSLLYKTDGVPIDKSIGTMVLERIVDMVTMLAIGALLFALQYQLLFHFFQETFLRRYGQNSSQQTGWIVFLLVVLTAGGLAILWLLYRFRMHPIIGKVWNFVKGVKDGLLSIRQLQKPWLFVFYSVLIWVMYFGMIYLCFRALPETTNLGIGAGMACLFFGGFAFIISQGGIGAYPATIAAVLMLYGIVYEVGFAFGWLVWALQTAAVIFCGVVSLLLISRNFSSANTLNR